MITSEARIPTTSGTRYAKQLCAHASRMGAHAEWTPPEGVVDFPQGGTLRITARSDDLRLVAEAETSDQLAVVQAIIARNLGRFGHRDGVRVDWSKADDRG